MSGDVQPDRMAMATAEEVLRTIYGDDLQGCPVTLEEIGCIIHQGFQQRGGPELLELYEKLIEAIHLLSTPPDATKVKGSEELQSLLGDRLDAIYNLTKKAIQTTAPFRSKPAEES